MRVELSFHSRQTTWTVRSKARRADQSRRYQISALVNGVKTTRPFGKPATELLRHFLLNSDADSAMALIMLRAQVDVGTGKMIDRIACIMTEYQHPPEYEHMDWDELHHQGQYVLTDKPYEDKFEIGCGEL